MAVETADESYGDQALVSDHAGPDDCLSRIAIVRFADLELTSAQLPPHHGR